MLRGKKKITLLSNAISPEQPSLFPDEPSLHEQKVELLCARYYYLLEVHEPKLKYDDMLIRLSKEFFISTGRVADLLALNTKNIEGIRNQSPKPTWFKINWAHIVW